MTLHIDALDNAVGREFGPSRWFVVDQTRIDGFAEVTEDEQWIHVDPARAVGGPFGTTIAHGYLTLSLVSAVLADLITHRRRGHGDQLRARPAAFSSRSADPLPTTRNGPPRSGASGRGRAAGDLRGEHRRGCLRWTGCEGGPASPAVARIANTAVAAFVESGDSGLYRRQRVQRRRPRGRCLYAMCVGERHAQLGLDRRAHRVDTVPA